MAVTHDFETVFREVFPRLVSLGTLKTGRVDVARDLAQETMLRAHARWGELTAYNSPEAWCHTVMTNLLIDHHRSAASEQRAVDRLGQPEPADTDTAGATAPSPWNHPCAGLPAPPLPGWERATEPCPPKAGLGGVGEGRDVWR